MRQLLLLAAMAASVHVSAQKFTPVTTGACWPTQTGFDRVCSGVSPSGFSHSDYGSGTYWLEDPYPTDVQVTSGGTRREIYSIGVELSTSPRSTYFMRRNAITGQIIQVIKNTAPGSYDATNRAITYDAANDRLYVGGTNVTATGSQAYIKRFNYATNSFTLIINLPTSLGTLALSDVLVDNGGNIYALCYNTSGGGFIVFKYNSAAGLTGTLNSSSISGLTGAVPSKFEYDDATGNIYICGRTSFSFGSAFICGITTSLAVLGSGTDANSDRGYEDIDFDNNGNLFAIGHQNNSGNVLPTWAEWDVSTYTTNFTGTDVVNIGGGLRDLLIDPNGRYVIAYNDYITYLDLATNQVHLGTDAANLGMNGVFTLHRDINDGSFVICGLGNGFGSGPFYPTEYVAKYNYSGGPTDPLGANPWIGYENKSTTSISALEKDNSIVLHPNPATNRLSIDLKGNDANNYRIINNMGQMVSKGYMLAQRATIDVSMLQPGQYYLQLLNNTQAISTQTFTKQ